MSLSPPAGIDLVYIIGTYPLLTTTFIDREINALRQGGTGIEIVSIRRPGSPLSSEQRNLTEGVVYVLPARALPVIRHVIGFALRRPMRLTKLTFRLLTGDHPSFWSRVKTLGHVILGVHIAGTISPWMPRRVHAHFLDRAATVGMVVSRLLDIPFSATAHANDIYVAPVLLAEKARMAQPLVTCTAYNVEHLTRVTGREDVRLIHHGLDLDAYRPSQEARNGRTIVSVGQLKEKKGFRYLIAACRRLHELGWEFRCEIVGGGPLEQILRDQVEQSGLGEVVTLRGAVDHARVIELLDTAGVFALASITADDGDRDGIPNVILEAMAMELPVVSTDQSGIPEVVKDGVTGRLVPPGDSDALAQALASLLEDPHRAESMGREGRAAVEKQFDARVNAAAFAAEILS